MRCFFVKPGGQIARLQNKKKKKKKSKTMFCHDNSQRDWYVMYMTMLMCLVLAG